MPTDQQITNADIQSATNAHKGCVSVAHLFTVGATSCFNIAHASARAAAALGAAVASVTVVEEVAGTEKSPKPKPLPTLLFEDVCSGEIAGGNLGGRGGGSRMISCTPW